MKTLNNCRGCEECEVKYEESEDYSDSSYPRNFTLFLFLRIFFFTSKCNNIGYPYYLSLELMENKFKNFKNWKH